MSADLLVPDGPICCCLGCGEPADHVINHPDYGDRTVCEGHAEGFEVVRDV